MVRSHSARTGLGALDISNCCLSSFIAVALLLWVMFRSFSTFRVQAIKMANARTNRRLWKTRYTETAENGAFLALHLASHSCYVRTP